MATNRYRLTRPGEPLWWMVIMRDGSPVVMRQSKLDSWGGTVLVVCYAYFMMALIGFVDRTTGPAAIWFDIGIPTLFALAVAVFQCTRFVLGAVRMVEAQRVVLHVWRGGAGADAR